MWETFLHHVTGRDRISFPVLCVTDLVDSTGARYEEGVDFDVEDGQIVWTGARRPGIDPQTMKGRVCSVRYTYKPFWYVKNLIHEVRVAQIEDFEGNRHVERMPQSAVLQREYQFQKEQNDALTADSARKKPGPDDGGFGPR